MGMVLLLQLLLCCCLTLKRLLLEWRKMALNFTVPIIRLSCSFEAKTCHSLHAQTACNCLVATSRRAGVENMPRHLFSETSVIFAIVAPSNL